MDKAKKKRLKRALTWAGIAALVALLALMPLLARQEAQADGPVASILSAQVTRKDIPQVLRGGGTLKNKNEQEVNLPTGVKITEFLVKNGDTVEAGDPVALVDTVSVMAAITDVAETMEFLREELEAGREEKVDSTVTATAGGRVKEVFAQAGDSVQDVMLRQGALALLSIDGLMTVKLESASPVTTGESVTVAINGEDIAGRVESNLSGEVIVTVEDEGYAIGEAVTVTCADGTELGEGTLYVHNAWKAVAYSGTVSKVNVRKEQVLSSGASLFTLTDTDYEGQLRRRASQHREYEELLQRLLAMYESGCLTAPCGGTVSGVDEDSVHLLSAGAEAAQVTLLDGGGMGTVRLMLLSNTACTEKSGCTAASHTPDCEEGCTGAKGCLNNLGKHKAGCPEECTGTKSCQAASHQASCIRLCTKAKTTKDVCNAKTHYEECIKSCVSAAAEGVCRNQADQYPHYGSCIESCDGAKTAADICDATGAHKQSCICSCIRADVTDICKHGISGAPHYIDCIESCTGKQDCPASKHLTTCQQYGMTYTATAALVYSVGTTELVVFRDASGTAYPVEKTASGWAISGAKLNEALLVKQDVLPAANAQQFKAGDILLTVTGHKGTDTFDMGTVFYKKASSGGMQDAMGGFDMSQFGSLSGMMGGFSGYGSYSGISVPETEDLHDLEGSPLLTITSGEGIQVEILLDERDIALVQEGMEATIKVEALNGQSVTGKVTKVGASGTHSGSTGKFTVQVETDAIPGSLPGMSCKVTIHRETKKDVLTLPVAALVQEGAKTLVYTALDAKTGQPAAPKEITTGVSDGETVEVFGLEEGVTVYYPYYDVLELDHTARERQFNLN